MGDPTRAPTLHTPSGVGALTTVFHYDQDARLIAETTEAGAVLREYVYLEDRLVALFEGGDLLIPPVPGHAQPIEGKPGQRLFSEAVQVTVIADRGFEDCNLFSYLSEELRFGYVVRLRGHVYVTSANGERRRAARWVGKAGRTRTLRDALVTDSHAYRVATVVCIHDQEMDQPWCLAASDPKAAARTLIGYYAKRWGIEASFRDIKDLRFGMGLSAIRISKPQRRDRLLLLSALAIALLSLLGAAGESLGYDRWLKANTVKRRTHSLFRQGLMLYEHIPNWPEQRLRPLMERFAEMLAEQRLFRDVFGVL